MKHVPTHTRLYGLVSCCAAVLDAISSRANELGVRRGYPRVAVAWLMWAAAIQGVYGALTSEEQASLPEPAGKTVEFSRDIRPILEASCVKCHGRGRDKGGFRVDSRATVLAGGDSGPAVVLGRSAESYLVELVAGVDPDNVMPQKGSRLTADQVGLVRAWIDQDLVWDEEVSLAKAPARNLQRTRPDLPPAQPGSGLSNPIDLLLQDYFQEHDLKWGDPVDDRHYMRRVYLDATGLLPPPVQVSTFAASRNSDKRRDLVRRLLSENSQYAAHWMTFWNDLLRNDYRGTGYIDDGRLQISAWLYSALARNVPYDQFVAQLLDPTPESEGFIKGIVWRGVVNASQRPEMQAAQSVSQVFLGVNLKCASCHDSFINDWALADAYGLANVFAEEPLAVFQCDKPTGKMAATRFLYPELGEIPSGTSRDERLERLASLMTSEKNGRLTRTIVNRLWARFMGRGLVEPLDDMEQPAWHPPVLNWLAEDLVEHGYDLKRTISLILTSRTYQMPGADLGELTDSEFVFRGPGIRRMSAEQFRDAFGCIAGVWEDKAATSVDFTAGEPDPVAPYWSLMPSPAKWIWRQTNAAAGVGPAKLYLRREVHLPEDIDEAFAVAACDNEFTLFVNGKQVARGRNWKKPEFIDLREHIRKGQNILAIAAENTGDEENPAGMFFYARLRRGGDVLDVVSDGSWVCTPEKAEDWEQGDFDSSAWQPAVELGEIGMEPWDLQGKLRRTLSMVRVLGRVRAALANSDPLTSALGRPPREQVVTRRDSIATTLQGLEMTNGDTLDRLIERSAKALINNTPSSPEQLIAEIYGKALGRKPTGAELEAALNFLGTDLETDGVQDLLWAVAMMPEFQLIY